MIERNAAHDRNANTVSARLDIGTNRQERQARLRSVSRYLPDLPRQRHADIFIATTVNLYALGRLERSGVELSDGFCALRRPALGRRADGQCSRERGDGYEVCDYVFEVHGCSPFLGCCLLLFRRSRAKAL